MNRIILIGVMFVTLVASTNQSFSSCTVLDNGKRNLIGKFDLLYAHNSCLTVYRKHYLRKNNDGDSKLYLRCTGKTELIALVRSGKYYEEEVTVSGCGRRK